MNDHQSKDEMAKERSERIAAVYNEWMCRYTDVFNEWMRRYIEEPERFSREWQDVKKYLDETAAGKSPSYGERCAVYFTRISRELFGVGIE